MTSGRRARVVVTVGVFAGVMLASTGLISRAGAHAQVRKSSPADGALLDKAPTEVVITFTEPPDPQLSNIDVLSSTGQAVTTGNSEPVPGDAHQLRVGLQDLPRGVYTITWRTVSKVDGHVTGGSLSFGVGVAPPERGSNSGVATETSNPTPLSVAGRWGLYVGLVLLLAAWPVGAGLARDQVHVSTRVLGIGWAIGLAGLALMFVAESRAVGVPMGTLASSATGRQLIYQGIGLAVAGAAILAYVARPIRPVLAGVGLAAAATMLVHAQAGHAGAASSWTWAWVGVQWIHMVAVGLWIGGLVWLLASLRRLEGDARRKAVARFSLMAGLTLAVVVGTGVAREIDELGGFGNFGALFDTSFGIALLVKTGLVVVLIALGARNRYVNVPAFAETPERARSLVRTVGAEVAIAVLVLGTTGVLSQFPPPADLRATSAERPATLVASGSDFGTTLKARLTVTPGTIGPNRFELGIADFDTGEPVAAGRVALRFSLPNHPEVGSTLELSRASAGVWRAQGTQLAINGTWDVSAVIQESSTSTTVDLKVTPRRPPQDIEVSEQAGQPTLYTIQLGGGSSLQAYVDPGKAGTNNVHFTFFDASGGELAVEKPSAGATSPDGTVESLKLQRFTPGHFVANVELEPGRWEFDVAGTSKDGPVSAYFSQTIAP